MGDFSSKECTGESYDRTLGRTAHPIAPVINWSRPFLSEATRTTPEVTNHSCQLPAPLTMFLLTKLSTQKGCAVLPYFCCLTNSKWTCWVSRCVRSIGCSQGRFNFRFFSKVGGLWKKSCEMKSNERGKISRSSTWPLPSSASKGLGGYSLLFRVKNWKLCYIYTECNTQITENPPLSEWNFKILNPF